MLRPCSLRARRAHSRYRAPNRRQVLNLRRVLHRRRVLKRRRVLNRWRMLRLLGSSLPIQCKSRHNRIVSTARRYLRLCLLPAKWEHVVPTYIQSGLTEIEVAHNMARRVATPRRRSKRKRMRRRRRRRRRLKGRRRRRREEEGGGRMPVTGVSCCRRPGNLKRTILPPTLLEMVKQHDFVNNTETVSSSKLLPRAVAQNLLFLFECSGSADAQRPLFLIEIHRVLSGVFFVSQHEQQIGFARHRFLCNSEGRLGRWAPSDMNSEHSSN